MIYVKNIIGVTGVYVFKYDLVKEFFQLKFTPMKMDILILLIKKF